jgi:sugar-specific transcriptional regulator TrmB
MNTTLQETLLKVGLEPRVIEIYLILIENGEMTVPEILGKTTLSRATVYEVLPLLLTQGFLEYKKIGRNAYYKPTHPSKLFSLIEERKREVALLEGEMGETIKTLSGTFNLAFNKPGVRFFEGEEGIQAVLDDSLTSKTEIYSYADIENIEKYISEINKKYVEKRQELEIHKKGLVLDTPFTREFLKDYYPGVTQAKLLPSEGAPAFHTVMQIYDNKISYITLSENNMIGVIIEEKSIYQMHKYIFEHLWKITPDFIGKNRQNTNYTSE